MYLPCLQPLFTRLALANKSQWQSRSVSYLTGSEYHYTLIALHVLKAHTITELQTLTHQAPATNDARSTRNLGAARPAKLLASVASVYSATRSPSKGSSTMATNIFESNEPQRGERATENAHRRIELQSPQALTYLIANVSRAARTKIDTHLPPDAAPEGEDAMRKRVEV